MQRAGRYDQRVHPLGEGDSSALGQAAEHLAQFLREHAPVFVLTGAGCSTESGIPDYRDDAGQYKRAEPMKFQQFFGSDESRRRYWSRSLAGFSEIADREPNAAHHGLAAFEAAGVSVPLITQNVDGLHQRAGSEGVLELHGSIFGVRCLSCQGQTSRREFQQRLADMNPNFVARVRAVAPDGDAELDGASLDDFLVPECEKCRGILKPDVVFFGESVPADWVARAYARLEAARGVLVVGSSLMVFSGYRFAKRANTLGVPLAIVNRGRTRADTWATLRSAHNCAMLLPETAKLLL
jgi:NAD-dependent SIR2 family protein deacetylase